MGMFQRVMDAIQNKPIKQEPIGIWGGGSGVDLGSLIDNVEPLRSFDSIPKSESKGYAAATGAYNGWKNSVASIGANNSLSQYNSFIMGRLSYQECAFLSNDPFISRAVNTITNEIFKEGGKYKDNNTALASAVQLFNVKDVVRTACLRALEYGGAMVYIDTSDEDTSSPLRLNSWTLSTGRLKGFRVVEPWQYAPVDVNAINPLKSDYMRPNLWWVNGAVRNVHSSRLIPVTFFSVVDLLKPMYNYMGLPLSFFMRDFVSSAETSRKCVADMLLRFKTDYFKTTAQKIADPKTKDRVKFMNETRNNFGAILLAEDEEMAQVVTPVTGLGDIVSQQYEIMTAITGLPITKFMGQTPRGFNATGEHDLKNHYDTIANYQSNVVAPIFTRIGAVISHLHLGVAENPEYIFNPIDRLSAKEKAEIASLNMDAVNKAIDAGIATAEDALKAVQTGDFSFSWVKEAPGVSFGDLVDELEPNFVTTDADWDEGKHPRGDDGRFGSGGKKKESDNNAIEISGNELGEYSNDKELREAAENYYRKNLQGTSVTNPNIGEINFTRKGIKETTNFSANTEKLKLIPYLKDIIETGKAGEWEKLNHPRKDDIVAFIPITNTVNFNGNKKNVEVLIGKDSNGNLYYDMFIDNSRKRFVHDKKPIVTYPEQNQGPQWVKGQLLATKDNVHSSDLEVNLFLNEE